MFISSLVRLFHCYLKTLLHNVLPLHLLIHNVRVLKLLVVIHYINPSTFTRLFGDMFFQALEVPAVEVTLDTEKARLSASVSRQVTLHGAVTQDALAAVWARVWIDAPVLVLMVPQAALAAEALVALAARVGAGNRTTRNRTTTSYASTIE